MRTLTYGEYDESIEKLAEKIKSSGKSYDYLFPIPRGGYYPAIKLSELLSIPVTSVYDKKEKTLVVDDIVETGSTLSEYGNADKAVVFAESYSVDKVQYYGEVKTEWLMLPDEVGCGIEDHIRRILEFIGEQPERDGLIGTPDRIIRMWHEIFRGYDKSMAPRITTFPNEDKVSDIVVDSGEYYSMCEHHMMPFFGKYCFAYIPNENGRIIGLSKIGRVVDYCSAKLQLQERLAKEIVTTIEKELSKDGNPPLGMAIMMRGKHLCKTMRGARKNGLMSSMYCTGVFQNGEKRKEFMQIANENLKNIHD